MAQTEQQIIAMLTAEIARLQQEIAEQQTTLQDASKRIVELEKLLIQLKYQPPQEVRQPVDNQPTLFDPSSFEADQEDVTEEEIPSYTRKKKKKKRSHTGRKGLPEHLERKEIRHEVDPQDLPDYDASQTFKIIRYERSEELIYIPPDFLVHVHLYPVVQYTTKSEGESTLYTYGNNNKVFSKSTASPELLTRIAMDRWDSAMSLYRIERWFKDHNCPLARSTLCTWMIKLGQLLEPIAHAQMYEIFKGFKIHVDDTNVQIQDKGNGKTKKHKLWVFMGGDDTFTHIVFRATHARNTETVLRLLSEYKGYLQVDACNVYDELFKYKYATEVGCWSHVFRKFKEICNVDKRARKMMRKIKRLCEIEDAARDLTNQQRYNLRQASSKFLLEELKEWVEVEFEKELLETNYKKALGYMRNHWVSLNRYLEDGRLRMDNNPAEAEFHNFGITRRNHLFLGEEGIDPAAVIFGLIRTCRANDIDPYAYLTDATRQMSQGHLSPEELTPQRWQARNA